MHNLDYNFIKSAKEQNSIGILLHGYGSNKEDITAMVPSLDKMQNTSFVVPNAPTPYNGGVGYQWFPLVHIPLMGVTIKSIKDIIFANTYLDKFVQLIAERYNIPIKKIFLFGFSQGGIMALFHALHTSNQFAAVACHSGAYYEHKSSVVNKKQNILLVHGKKDHTIPFSIAKRTMKFFEQNDIKYSTFFKESLEHSVDNETIENVEEFFLRNYRN